MKYLNYFRFQKLIVYTVITLIAAQLVYLYSPLGYIHAVLYFFFLLINDIYKPEYRKVKLEIIENVLYVITTAVVAISPLIGASSKYIYYILIIILAVMNIKHTIDFKNVFKYKELDKVNNRNIKMFQKDGKFLFIYSYLVIMILTGIAGMSIYLMFK